MSIPCYVEDCLNRKTLFITGKGGVGKSSIAWATAQLCRRHHKKVAVLSWNPFAKSLPPLTNEEMDGVDWIPLETLAAFREYTLKIVKFEKVYRAVFENEVFKKFILFAPGLAESVAAGKIWDLGETGQYDLIIVDLPSSGHALSFFKSPKGVSKLFKTGFIHRDAEKVCALFESPETRIDLVTLPEELPTTECRQLKEQLDKLFSFHFGFVHFNQCTPQFPLPDGLPESAPLETQEIYQWHTQRTKEENETLEKTKSMQLPITQIPRFAESETTAILRQMAQTLENA